MPQTDVQQLKRITSRRSISMNQYTGHGGDQAAITMKGKQLETDIKNLSVAALNGSVQQIESLWVNR